MKPRTDESSTVPGSTVDPKQAVLALLVVIWAFRRSKRPLTAPTGITS